MNAAVYARLNKVLQKLETAVQLALANANQEDPERRLLGEMRDIIVKVRQELRPPQMVPVVEKEGRGKNVLVVAGVAISLATILTFLKILALIALVSVLGYLYGNYVAPRLQERGISGIFMGVGLALVVVRQFQQVRARVEQEIGHFPHCSDNWRRFIQACAFLMRYAQGGQSLTASRTLRQQIERNIDLLIDALESLILCMDPDDTTGLYDEIIGPSGRVRFVFNRVKNRLGDIIEAASGIRRPSQLEHLRSRPSGQ